MSEETKEEAKPIPCASCGKIAARPRHFRRADYCGVECINKAIAARNERVAEAAKSKPAEASPE